MLHAPHRRQFLKTAALATASVASGVLAQEKPIETLVRQDIGVDVLFPRDRVPLSFIIDDSTCLVNMGRFCMPQFAEAWPDRAIYKKPWRTWPTEIPDAFVREFGEWCGERGVKGKYSVVPNPALVGWLDRELPGWSRRELQDSLKLVRELMLPNWDIHPEMITHTRVIDLKTGKAIPEISPATMENSFPQERKSVDEMAAYLAYALRILKNCELPCEGVTTPGGFGNAVKSELSRAVQEAVRDVYHVEIPHYFKYVSDGEESTEPKLEHVSGLGTNDLQLTVNVPAGTGDWFGGWDGDEMSQGERYANREATAGRMVELIEQHRPAVMLCHWPGMYTHGTKAGFHQFRQVVTALEERFRDQTVWMKVSEMARYWAAKGLTEIRCDTNVISLKAPFAAPNFTLRIAAPTSATPRMTSDGKVMALKEAASHADLAAGRWWRDKEGVMICFDLPRGDTTIQL